MIKANNVPRLRFPGFADNWEERKFGEFFNERNERSGEGEMISVTINSGIKKFVDLNRFDTKPSDLSKYKKVVCGDIAYNSMRMWQGASGYSPYTGILSPAYTVITPKSNALSNFFAYVLKRPSMIHKFKIYSQGLTKDTWNLKFPAFSQIKVKAPTAQEQQKISDLFLVLDNLITLHQNKIEAIKKYKAGMLQKMFPREGETVPEIRFPGFVNSWEQRKFEDYFDERNERSGEGEMISVTINSGIKKSVDLNKSNTKPLDLSKYKRVVCGDIAYNSMHMWEGASGYSPYTGILSPAYTVITPKSNALSNFFAYVLKIPSMIHKFKIYSQGSIKEAWSLKFPAFSQIKVKAPTIQEQQRIAIFFQALDNLINFHQREYDKLKELKKGLLQQMFV